MLSHFAIRRFVRHKLVIACEYSQRRDAFVLGIFRRQFVGQFAGVTPQQRIVDQLPFPRAR